MKRGRIRCLRSSGEACVSTLETRTHAVTTRESLNTRVPDREPVTASRHALQACRGLEEGQSSPVESPRVSTALGPSGQALRSRAPPCHRVAQTAPVCAVGAGRPPSWARQREKCAPPLHSLSSLGDFTPPSPTCAAHGSHAPPPPFTLPPLILTCGGSCRHPPEPSLDPLRFCFPAAVGLALTN